MLCQGAVPAMNPDLFPFHRASSSGIKFRISARPAESIQQIIRLMKEKENPYLYLKISLQFDYRVTESFFRSLAEDDELVIKGLILINADFSGDETLKSWSDFIQAKGMELKEIGILPATIPNEALATIADLVGAEGNVLKRLALQQARFNKDALSPLVNAIGQGHCKLSVLNFTNAEFLDEILESLLQSLATHQTPVETLYLAHANLNLSQMEALAGLLATGKSKIRNLDLSSNKLDAETSDPLARAMKNNAASLRRLDISRNNLGYDGVKQFAAAFDSGKTPLRLLDIQSNNVDPSKRMEALTALVGSKWAPQRLGIHILDDEIDNVAEALKTNGSIIIIFSNAPHSDWDAFKPYLVRNREARNRARKAVEALYQHADWLKFGGGAKQKTKDSFSEKMGKQAAAAIMESVAAELWKTRFDPVWWTEEERNQAGIGSDAVEPALKRVKRMEQRLQALIGQSVSLLG